MNAIGFRVPHPTHHVDLSSELCCFSGVLLGFVAVTGLMVSIGLTLVMDLTIDQPTNSTVEIGFVGHGTVAIDRSCAGVLVRNGLAGVVLRAGPGVSPGSPTPLWQRTARMHLGAVATSGLHAIMRAGR